MWLYRVDGGDVLAWAQTGVVALVLTCWHRSLASGHVGRGEPFPCNASFTCCETVNIHSGHLLA
jgi:hypothetical protein